MVASATIPNSDIVLRRSGHGDNAVVFVHGFLDDQYAWNPVLADLSAPAFETIQFDQAGFGDRAEPSGPINFDLFAGDLAAVVDAVDKPFVLVGHSMAAPIVELVASARPARAQGLVLVAPIPMAGAHLPDEFMEVFGSVETYLTTRRQAAPLRESPLQAPPSLRLLRTPVRHPAAGRSAGCNAPRWLRAAASGRARAGIGWKRP